MRNRFLLKTHFKIYLKLLLLFGLCTGISFIIFVVQQNIFTAIWGSFPSLSQFVFFNKLISLHLFLMIHSWIELIPLFMVTLLLLIRHFAVYLVKVKEAVRQIAAGDTDCRVLIKYNNELTELARYVNELVEQLEARRKEANTAEQSKNELIVNVSHDLRTPLTSILGYLDLINHGQYQNEEGLLYYIKIIDQKAKRLQLLIDDLFEFVVTKNPKVVLRLQTLSLKELLIQMISDFNIKKKEVPIKWCFSEGAILVKADGDRLARAFENLISNAIKYGDNKQGIDIIGSISNGMVHVQIINYGLPIPEFELPRIFNQFYRIEKSRSDETGGTGLGLSIAKNIIELHQGTITVESNDSRTSFEVILPL